MSFIRETIKSKIESKKGFTIIEILLVISLVFIIVTLQVTVISKYMKLHRKEINYSRECFYINEAFMIIENEIKNAKCIDIENNMIILKRYDNKGYDYIKKNRGSAVVVSYGAIDSPTVNNVLKGVKEFQVEKHKKVFYVSINMEKGNFYTKCFAIEREKLRKDLY
ncbi:competence type IV pilus minor pilin ComGF [Clostridium sp. WILCCON 0269]|uniref:Competence type IV pilus minor pilin ComGF n=1 Tax=Candidatus Clostridium eludens TaxID=3381663 RepID=A0ABW8SLQ0_9CLOT